MNEPMQRLDGCDGKGGWGKGAEAGKAWGHTDPCGFGGKGAGCYGQPGMGGARMDDRSRSPLKDGGHLAMSQQAAMVARGKYPGPPQVGMPPVAATSKASSGGFCMKGGPMPGMGEPHRTDQAAGWAAGAAMQAGTPKMMGMGGYGAPPEGSVPMLGSVGGQMQLQSGAVAKGGPMPGSNPGLGACMKQMATDGAVAPQFPNMPGGPSGFGMSKSSGPGVAPPRPVPGPPPPQPPHQLPPLQQQPASAQLTPARASVPFDPEEPSDPQEAKDMEVLAQISAGLLQPMRNTEEMVTQVSQAYANFLKQTAGDPRKAEAMVGQLDSLDKMISAGEERVSELGRSLGSAVSAAKQLKTEAGKSKAASALEQVQNRFKQFMTALADTKNNRQQLTQKISASQAVKDLMGSLEALQKDVAVAEEAVAATSLESQPASVLKELRETHSSAGEKVKNFTQVLAERKAASTDSVQMEIDRLDVNSLEARLRELDNDIKVIEREAVLVNLRGTLQKRLQQKCEEEGKMVEELRRDVGEAAKAAALAGAGPNLLGLLGGTGLKAPPLPAGPEGGGTTTAA